MVAALTVSAVAAAILWGLALMILSTGWFLVCALGAILFGVAAWVYDLMTESQG